jgi:thioredoxin reductase
VNRLHNLTVYHEGVAFDGLAAVQLEVEPDGGGGFQQQAHRLDVDASLGAFLAVGLAPQNEPFAGLTALNDWGYFDSDESCTTPTAGLFVAGDCRSKTIRQVVTAASDGAAAAMAACRYLEQQ